MLSKETVLEFWRTEEYKKLSRHLINRYSGSTSGYVYGGNNTESNTVNIDGKTFLKDEVIEFLDDIMKPIGMPNSEYYFRGDTFLNPGISCKKENYISITLEQEDAIQFINDSEGGTLSFIKVDPTVKCIKTGVEKEILLQHGCIWEALGESVYEHTDFHGNKINYRRVDVKIHPPSNASHTYQYCSKTIPHGAQEELVKQAKVSLDVYRERLRPFYNQYREESREFSNTPKSEEFLESIREITNIPSNTKRELYSEFRSNSSTVGKKKHKTIKRKKSGLKPKGKSKPSKGKSKPSKGKSKPSKGKSYKGKPPPKSIKIKVRRRKKKSAPKP